MIIGDEKLCSSDGSGVFGMLMNVKVCLVLVNFSMCVVFDVVVLLLRCSGRFWLLWLIRLIVNGIRSGFCCVLCVVGDVLL